MSNTKPVVRSIDVGYGNTKFIKKDVGGQMIADHFPSIVNTVTTDRDSITDTPNVFVVEVDGTKYEVGRGLDAALEGNMRILHDNYIDTDQYMALNYGALSQMDVDEIDLLMVGLPVDLLSSKRKALEVMLTGEHQVAGRTVTIHKVNAVAQPLGGFLYHAANNNMLSGLNSSRNLLVDPGFFTVDFLVSAGLREVKGMSGSHPTGVSAYLKYIAKEISRDFNVNFDNISKIDEGVRTGVFKLYGKDVDLTKYHKKALSAIMPGVEAIANVVGDGINIDRVVLIGGGASIFKGPIEAILPNHKVHCNAEHAVVANVLGYQLMGNAWIASSKITAA